MPTIKELQEKRAPIRSKLLAIGEKIKSEGRAMNDEERKEFDSLKSEFDTISGAINDAEAFERFNEDGSRSDRKVGRGDADPRREKRDRIERQKHEAEERKKITDQDRAIAFQAWVRKANGRELKRTHREACEKVGLNPNRRTLDIRLPQIRNGKPDLAEYRDMGVSLGTAGGYTVAPEFVAMLEKAMLAYNGLREVASVMRTSTGAPMPWPTINDTGNSGERIDENTAVAVTPDPSVGSVTFNAYKYSSKLIPVAEELLNDSAFNLAAEIFPMLGERIGRVQAVDFTTGTGSGQPDGVITRASEGVDAAGTSLTINDLLNLIRSVDVAYRNGPSVGFMCHDTILGKLLQLVDLQGLPYLLQNYREGERVVTLQGFPFYINQAMDSTMANTKKTVLFGDFSKYKIRDVGTIRLKRLDERYAEKDQVGFVAFLRSDGRTLNAGTNPFKYLIHTT